MKNDVVISVKNLHKSFELPVERASGLKQAIFNRLKGVKGYKEQKVLKGLNFDIHRGEFIGIVGRNGSGKSTLLKTLAKIYFPEKGSVEINGTLVPFIELGVGFNPDLTGRENVYLNGALLGFSNKEMDAMYDEIVDFAELEDFMDQKLKNYSSGMQVRLAFSIAIRARGDILVLDEVLAVGDEAFQNKCNHFFDQIKKDKSKTVILVTHSMDSVRKYCNRAIFIRNGKIEIDGSPEDVANNYSLENTQSHRTTKDHTNQKQSLIENLQVKLLSSSQISQTDLLELKISYSVKDNIDTFVALTLWDITREQAIINSNSKPHLCTGKGKKELTFKTTLTELNDTNIRILVSIRNQSGEILAFNPQDSSPTFILRRNDYPKKTKNKPTEAILFNRGEFSINRS